MKTDITALLNGRASSLDIDYGFMPDEAGSPVTLPEEIDIASPVRVRGKIADQNGVMSLHAGVTVKYSTVCDRCLDEINGELSFDVDKTVSTDEPPEGYEDDPSWDDVLFVEESAVDIDRSLVEEIAVRLPPYHLCSEDCPGLCPRCGKKLKDGVCTCKEEKEIDPRLKILQKLLD
ncbi:MAG: DUF177 domain-containing protein [Clostridia bacterium]|nr:DUF177 domain-containing protein [Clostridia bacterium]